MRISVDVRLPRPDDVNTGTTVISSGHPYARNITRPPEPVGGAVELCILSNENSHPDIEICGKASDVKKLLQDALDAVSSLEEHFAEEDAAYAKNAIRCSACEAWYDPTDDHKTHSDGRGGRCEGEFQ